MIDRQMIYDLRDQIVQEFQPYKIVLFGSYAYGNPSPDSDVDLLVILPFEGKSAQKSAEILHKTDPRFPIDLLVRSPEQVNDRVSKGDFFLREILDRGEVLYESAHARMGRES